ncbi:Uncharacterised protein [uncultured archaeon]|nr:Uncharacterised protein [uncultured archaeon]
MKKRLVRRNLVFRATLSFLNFITLKQSKKKQNNG